MRNPVKSFSIAVHGAVPLKAKINNGELSSEYDLPKAISEALDFYVTWKKRTGTKPPLKQAAEEIDMFKNDGEQLSDSAKKIVMLIADNIRKTRKMSDGIERAVRAINSENEAKLPGTQEHNRNFGTILDDSFNGLDEPLSQVTNRELSASDRIEVVDVTDATQTRVGRKKKIEKLISSLLNKTIYFHGGEGFVSVKDEKAEGEENPWAAKQLIHSHDRAYEIYNSKVRTKVLTKLGEVLSHGIYIDKHPDYAHGTTTKYIEIFVPVRCGDDLYTFQVTARERGDNPGEYTVGKALFYNIKIARDLEMRPNNGNKNASSKSLAVITIAALLAGVKD